MKRKVIIGAGMSGLIAGHYFKDAYVMEKYSHKQGGIHKALLRFRSDAISKITGIPFKEVTVRKAVMGQNHADYNMLQLANMYSMKVAGRVEARSIMNLDPVKRWIAPEDFYERLVSSLKSEGRLEFEADVEDDIVSGNYEIISTIPLPALLSILGKSAMIDMSVVKARPIFAHQYRLPDYVDVYQTMYCPLSDTQVYRASITGNLLIIESLAECTVAEAAYIAGAWFGIAVDHNFKLESAQKQELGKITNLQREVGRGLLYSITRDHGIYSLGRFATWRNILLDDLVNDMHQIDRLINASEYSRSMIAAGGVK